MIETVLPYVWMVFLAMPGPLLWAINTETILVYQVQQGLDPLLLALCAATGQVGTFLILYALGEQALMRIGFFARRIEAWPPEKRLKLRSSTTAGLVSGGLFGIPPVIVVAPFSSTVHYPRVKMCAIVFVTRLVRFTALTMGGERVLEWMGWGG